MKTLRTIVTTILILIIGSCALLFVGYKIFLDKPGFFRQFDNESEVREYLLNNLDLDEDNKDTTIEFIQQRLSDGDDCTPLLDATTDGLHCLVTGCPPATDKTINTVMHCLVRSSEVFVNYRISLFFEYNKLLDIDIEPRSGLP